MNIFDQMLDRTINTVGEWNAQLFRELKGRLTLKNFTLTLLGSLAAQALLIMIFIMKLPIDPNPITGNISQEYCFIVNRVCQLDRLGDAITNWLQWWSNILTAISWIISTMLVIGGVYFLANDLRREETRGTLDFVRLSPQSAAQMFMGKLLGVPILIYVAAASILPLQLIAGANSFGVVNTLVFDGLWLAIAGLFYLCAMLLVSMIPIMPIWIALLAWWIQSTVGMLMQFILSDHSSSAFTDSYMSALTWFYAVMFNSITNIMLFAIFNCGLIGYALWQMLCRRYMNPNNTLISKKQSYQFNGVLQIWLLGWAIPLSTSTPHVVKDILPIVGFVEMLFTFILISTIIPYQNVLQEWCRQTDLRVKKGFRRWWPDLIWDDRSPAVVALAINLGMAMAIWLIFGLIRSTPATIFPIGGFMLLAMLMLLIILNCGIAAQISAAHKLPGFLNRSMFMIVFTLHILMLSIMISAFGYQFMAIQLLIAFSIEFMMVPLMVGLMWKRLQRLGRSETQEIFKAA